MKHQLTRYLLLPIWLLISSPLSLQAQQGVEDIYRDIKKLGVLANVLYVAAHPDDENTRLISYFSNHLHVNTTYLSLTRGDGGQNLIGPEMREMLGVIRSHELLEARKIDGGNQMFTRANDFGYSKSPSETFKIWGKDEILGDVVWAIRKTKPDVIINRFSNDATRPNHGHHTASAILAIEAFDLAGKKEAYPDQLEFADTWQPHRIYWNTSWWFFGSRENFEKSDKSRMHALDIGAFDPVSGESNSEIAGRSRSMHKSQGFGAAETRGESLEYIDLVKDRNNIIPASVFDGIDISWNRVTGGTSIGQKVTELEKQFDFKSPKSSIPLLLDIYGDINALPDSDWKQIKLMETRELIRKCLGLYIEVRSNRYHVSPGRRLSVTVEVINRSDVNSTLDFISITGLDSVYQSYDVLANNQGWTKDFMITVPDQLSIPYWLKENTDIGLYAVAQLDMIGQPADDPAMKAQIGIIANGVPISFSVPVIFKTVDPAEGEITKPIYITPPVAVDVAAEVLVFNQGESRIIPITLTAMDDGVTGEFKLHIPESGWKVEPLSTPVSFTKTGETRIITCTITSPAKAARASLRPEFIINGHTYHHKIKTIEYDHLPYMSIVSDATTPLQSLDIKISHRTIGYIEGAGDDVAGSLRQIGYKVNVLDPATLTEEMLQSYEVIILGVRAFNTVDALSHKNSVLFDWVERGGTLIAQYNVSRGMVTDQIAPYPISISRDRVTEEETPVRILAADHPALNTPNKISEKDFEGWVQERGLYFPGEWDAHFTPLLELADTGEDPKQGSLLVAPFGKGYYIYSGLSWFRHLPAGVPGSYRLLSNLISLGYKNNRS